MGSRIIALLDMDCFYVQVEQRANPLLKGKPVAVVQYNTWQGGGIIAVNYEARAHGVTRSMRGDAAKKQCPGLILVHVKENRGKADISKYRNAGCEVVDVLCQFSNCVERASIDEAYLDLTEVVQQRMQANSIIPSLDQLKSTFVLGFHSKDVEKAYVEEDRVKGLSTWLEKIAAVEASQEEEVLLPGSERQEMLQLAIAAQIVEEMRAAVLAQTGFTCSGGIAHNKPLSKLICGMHKPNQQTVLPKSGVVELYSNLPVKKMRSLGGKLGDLVAQKLDIKVIAELEKFSEAELCQHFDAKIGNWLYNIARGVDNDPVTARLTVQSISCCKRFPGSQNLKTRQKVEHWIGELAKEVTERLQKDFQENGNRRARNMIVQWSHKIGGKSSSKSGPMVPYDSQQIAAAAMHLVSNANTAPPGSAFWEPPLQFLGLCVGKFSEEENKKMSIQNFFKSDQKTEKLNFKQVYSVSNSDLATVPHENDFRTRLTPSSKIKNKQQSFFLNYLKKAETKPSTSKINNESTHDFEDENFSHIPASYEVDLSDKVELSEIVDKSNVRQEEVLQTYCKTSEQDNLNVNTVEERTLDQMPCPQCDKLVCILDMDSHLDHHIALDLHKKLNSERPIATVVKLNNSLTNQIAKKRKYTKSVKNVNENKKNKGDIASFFAPHSS